MRQVTTWDGSAFAMMPEDEAKKLEAEDKIQILNQPQIDGLAMKTRKQFTGYKTREIRASAPAEPKQLADYSAYTVNEIKDMIVERGLKLKGATLKKDLIAILVADDE